MVIAQLLFQLAAAQQGLGLGLTALLVTELAPLRERFFGLAGTGEQLGQLLQQPRRFATLRRPTLRCLVERPQLLLGLGVVAGLNRQVNLPTQRPFSTRITRL